ncbi:MAG TPA: hypothetical protein VII06_30075 [Chloroflexota bacterium]|jgi:hypothetical protein
MGATADRLLEIVRVLAIGYTADDVLRAAVLIAVALLGLAGVALVGSLLRSLAGSLLGRLGALRSWTRRGPADSCLALRSASRPAPADARCAAPRAVAAYSQARPHQSRISLAPVAR